MYIKHAGQQSSQKKYDYVDLNERYVYIILFLLNPPEEFKIIEN
jgi:hypothetical protein